MTDTVVIHKGALQKVSPFLWPSSLDLKLGLLHEDSTAAPTVDDEFVSDLIPASNEMDSAEYARATLASKTATFNGTTDLWELSSATVTFAALTGGETLVPGISGYFLYANVSGDDTLSILIRTVVYDTVEDLNGSDYLVAPHSSGWLTVGQA